VNTTCHAGGSNSGYHARPLSLLLCFAFGSILNIFFVLGNDPSIVTGYKGYPGYFLGKNYLGEFSAIAFLLSLHEMLYPRLRRVLGIIFVVIATSLLFLSNSKTAFGLALFAPFLAGLTLIAVKRTRISPDPPRFFGPRLA
jgi:hypothetical protein